MKKIIFILSLLLLSNNCLAASTNSSNSENKTGLYKSAKQLILRAKKLEKAYTEDKKNPDILNYLGYTLRKAGDFKKAETYYLKGLELDAGHLGINEYLGELYVQTGRIELAKKRLDVLKDCKCEEYEELKELIEKN